MVQQDEGDACPAYVNQDQGALPEVVLPTSIPTLAQLLDKRQMIAFRAMGMLIAMSRGGLIPEVHVTSVNRLIAEYDAFTKAIDKELHS